MTVIEDIPVSLDAELLIDRYRVRPEMDHARFAELVAKVEDIARPKAVYEVAFIEEKGDDWVVAGDVRLTSRVLRKNLEEAERVFPYVATCGTEVDALKAPDGDIREKAWLYILRGEILQLAVARVPEHISHHYQVSTLSSMNPGSGDAAVWPLEEQKQLFALLGGAGKQIGVRLTESCLLIPEMSVSGVYFPTEKSFEGCQVCHRERCPGRRAPFSQDAWDALT